MTNLKTLLMATVAVFALGATVAMADNDARLYNQLAEANQDGNTRVIVAENDARPYNQLADANQDGNPRLQLAENDARPYNQLADANRDAYTQAVA